jgi:hypothetical protein
MAQLNAGPISFPLGHTALKLGDIASHTTGDVNNCGACGVNVPGQALRGRAMRGRVPLAAAFGTDPDDECAGVEACNGACTTSVGEVRFSSARRDR